MNQESHIVLAVKDIVIEAIHAFLSYNQWQEHTEKVQTPDSKVIKLRQAHLWFVLLFKNDYIEEN